MLQREYSAILLTFITLPIVIKIFVLSIFEWPLYTGFTVPYDLGVFSIQKVKVPVFNPFVFHDFFVVCGFFSQNYYFQKFFLVYCQCQTVWNQVRSDVLSGLI